MNEAARVEYKITDRGTVPVYADQIVEQPSSYKEEDHSVWKTLFEQQLANIQGKAYPRFMECLDMMPISSSGIPRFEDINAVLEKHSGWTIVAVNGLLSDVAFVDLLSQRKFPTTWWIRKKHQIEYIQEPDLFHDLFGHVPLLLNQDYSDVVQAFGEVGRQLSHSDPTHAEHIARLYWFSVEFGLIKDQDKTYALGAGLLSSPGEIDYALSNEPDKKRFCMTDVIKTKYHIDAYQSLYFVADSLQSIKKELLAYHKKHTQ